MDLKNLCRICLVKCENQMCYSIFSENTILKLNICGGLNIIENINLPEQMCEQCFLSLENAHQFRLTCQNTEKRLQELIKNKEFQTNSEKNAHKFNFEEQKLTIKTELNKNISEKFLESKNIETDSHEFKVESVQNDSHVKRKYTRKKSNDNKIKTNNNDKLTCHLCQVDYKAKNAYIYHMRRHRNEMDFICEICGNAFETNFKLSRHLLQHTGIKKYPCRTCDKSFPTSSNRDRHERRLHTTIRPFQCEYCIKVFAYSDQLKNHIRVHTGEKPFICDKCGTGFRRKSHLITHKKAITPCFLKNKDINDTQRIRQIK